MSRRGEASHFGMFIAVHRACVSGVTSHGQESRSIQVTYAVIRATTLQFRFPISDFAIGSFGTAPSSRSIAWGRIISDINGYLEYSKVGGANAAGT
jgi:hypothetical protein